MGIVCQHTVREYIGTITISQDIAAVDHNFRTVQRISFGPGKLIVNINYRFTKVPVFRIKCGK